MNISCPLKEAPSSSIGWVDKDRCWTYSEIDQLADCFAGELWEKGIGPLSRIATLLSPGAEFLALLFAAWRLGASLCPLNTRLPPKGIEAVLQKLSADLFLENYPLISGKRKVIEGFDASLPALFLATSGSTGEPKIAVLSAHNLLQNAKGALALLDLQPNDRWLLQLPLFHVGGIGILLRCLLAKAIIVSNPNDLAITHLSCVPTQLCRATPIYKTLRCALLGGAPVFSYPKKLPIFVTYGLTEMGSIVLAKKRPLDGYLGWPLDHREMKLASDGEILVRGECLFLGYLEKGGIKLPVEWFATKDLGKFDEINGFQITGRKDWLFISGGENIQPEEIERYILQIPGVQEAAVIPKKHPEFGQRPIAFVVGKLSLSSLKEELEAHLPKYKIPDDLICLEQLPKNGLKINRKALFEYFS